MNVVGIYIDSLSHHSISGMVVGSDFGNNPQACMSRDMVLLLEDKIIPVDNHSFSRHGEHKVCCDFLPWIGSNKNWGLGKFEISADYALEFYLSELQKRLQPGSRVAFALPVYLTQKQIRKVEQIASKIGYQVQGSLASATAMALSEGVNSRSSCDTIAVELDGFSLSVSHVRIVDGVANLVSGVVFPEFGLHRWALKLSDLIAEKTILHCRRDPRVDVQSDQMLFQQSLKIMQGIGVKPNFKIKLDDDFYSKEFVVARSEIEICFSSMVHSLRQKLWGYLSARNFSQGEIRFACASKIDAVPGLVDVLQQVTSGFSCPVLFSDDFVPPASLCSNVMTMAGKWWFDSMGGTSVTGYNWPIGSGKV